MQKSLSFIFPELEVGYQSLVQRGLVNSYMGSEEYPTENRWGDVFILEFSVPLSEGDLTWIMSNKYYKDNYISSSGTHHVVYEFTEDFKQKVVKPFLEGKYSQIDRDYVESKFAKNIIDANTGKLTPAPNYRILTKDPSILDYWKYDYTNLQDPVDKRFWATQTTLHIPEDAEVWSRPLQENEIYVGTYPGKFSKRYQ